MFAAVNSAGTMEGKNTGACPSTLEPSTIITSSRELCVFLYLWEQVRMQMLLLLKRHCSHQLMMRVKATLRLHAFCSALMIITGASVSYSVSFNSIIVTSSQSDTVISTSYIKRTCRAQEGLGRNILYCLSHKHCFDIIAALRVPEVESEPLLIGLNVPRGAVFLPVSSH